MAEPPQTGIGSPSAFPASSAPSSPPDPPDEAPPRLRSPWSQIVRGSPNPPRSKTADPSVDLHPDELTEKLHLQHLSSELRVTDRATTVNTTPVFSPSMDRRPTSANESHTEGTANSPDGSVNRSGFSDGKPSQQSPAKSPKQAWGRLVPNPVQSLEPEPVMGAVTWPALSEARNSKALESPKAGTVQKACLKATSPLNERHHLQAPPLLQRDTGAMDRQESNDQIAGNGRDPTKLVVHESPSPHKAMQGAYGDQSKWSGGKDPNVAAASEASPMHVTGVVTNHMNNKESSRNFMWEQGRGNHSFPAYGRGHMNSREHPVPVHQQRAGQRNVPQPFVPFGNPNPGFVYSSGYQVGGVDVPGSMYCMPAPTTDPVLAPTYFVQPQVFMPAPNVLTIQGMVLKQIEYYFSVENLCRDLYLRSRMDEWGFVPVSVIANFNRVRMITQNPYLIIEALRLSNVVEVQGDKIRKKGDWANWLIPSGQPSAKTSSTKDQPVQVLISSKKADVEHFTPDNSRFGATDNQINGHSHLVSQVEKQVAPSGTPANVQGIDEDSQSYEAAAGCVSDGEMEDLQLDGVNGKDASQPCNVESGLGMK